MLKVKNVLSVIIFLTLIFASAQGQSNEPMNCTYDSTQSQENVLVQKLLKNYNNHVKPTVNTTSQVTVYIQLSLTKVDRLDSETELLTTHGYLIMTWFDELFRWDPATHCGIQQVVVTSEDVWLPEIGIKNSAENGNDIGMYKEQEYRIIAWNTGKMRWAPLMSWLTTCKMSVYYFPFDKQVCQVVFANWMYNADLVNLTLGYDQLILEGFHNHSEWLLVDSAVGQHQIPITLDGKIYIMPTVYFTITLARAPSYYVVNVLLMSGVLTAMCLLMFALPVHAVDKVILGVTLLLSYAVLLITINDMTPKSETLPLAMIIICVEVMLCAISIICSTIVLRVHGHPPLVAIPHWAKRLLLKKIASWLSVTVVKEEYEDEPDTSLFSNKISPADHLQTQNSPNDGIRKLNIKSLADNDKIGSELAVAAEEGQSVNNNHKSLNSLEDEIREYINMKKSECCEERKQRLYEAEWRDFARVLDRLFLISFTFLFVLIHLILYLYLYAYVDHKIYSPENDVTQ